MTNYFLITKKFDIRKKRLNWIIASEPPQPLVTTLINVRNVVYMINCVWAVVLQECWRSFSKNLLHPSIQSDVDGGQQGLEPFLKISVFPKDRRFISSKPGIDPWRNGGATCVLKSADRQIAFCLYIVENYYRYHQFRL